MTFSEFPLIPLPSPQINWETEIYNLPQSFPTTWDDIANKPNLALADHIHSFSEISGYWQEIPGLEDTIQELANMSYINEYFVTKTSTNSRIAIKHVEFSQGSGWMQWNIGESGIIGDVCNWKDTLKWQTTGKLAFNGANYNADISFEYDWENGFTCMIISIDGVEKFRLEGGGWFQAPKIKTDLMSTKRAFITNCPTYSQASTGEIYKDANGFLKIR